MHVRLRDKLILLVQKNVQITTLPSIPTKDADLLRVDVVGGFWKMELKVISESKEGVFSSPYDDHQVIIKFNVNRLFKDNTHISTNMPLHCGEGRIRTRF